MLCTQIYTHIFKTIALLRYNPHVINCISWKCGYNSGIFSIFRELYNHHHDLTPKHVSHPPTKKPFVQSSYFPFTFSSIPWQPLICFLSLWICLVYTFHIHGFIQYVAFPHGLYFMRLMLERCYQSLGSCSHSRRMNFVNTQAASKQSLYYRKTKSSQDRLRGERRVPYSWILNPIKLFHVKHFIC